MMGGMGLLLLGIAGFAGVVAINTAPGTERTKGQSLLLSAFWFAGLLGLVVGTIRMFATGVF